MTTRWMSSPIGALRLHASAGLITAIRFDAGPPVGRRCADPLLDRAEEQLGEYFAGDRTEFDLPLASDGTEFQRKVWAELQRIPYGETASYGDIARRLGYEPVISRAVGAANGANPIPIVVPCHRVIGSNGTLTGYAGGVERKRTLLDLERPGLF
ncbi:methylated-DNA--[protein]-cysteine S-methyltransferase [Aeromicrobium sp. SMF47]|uniref:Methylated-DNA--protein-cysteine methyltransferase n=1 Tax=Aeromicrobium yanjiei TaxID=2662028 RepID=A0A5Q2MKR3_9ACTN|nr:MULTISPECIES: methylated-DNA--[protein]-cysteine S-methyltransferase [Aeromicrobium]MRJ77984.1 methylated-DNA--[protein]-cysteine S-methyltransferase [Aeromicrobium yanjiei]MRK02344.1 methylated-DNA--[protein]-cysteine S-methyltransferase [Aeromicrobium sp. S22]QGG40935.1 methylated-DNA--[protein]-cysteine S-methyltransferase [Aeromicrobium yanjiei]